MASPKHEDVPSEKGKEDGVNSDGKFPYHEIYEYLRSGSYPDGLDKAEKRAMRKRAARYFSLQDSELYYIGGESTSNYFKSVLFLHACPMMH